MTEGIVEIMVALLAGGSIKHFFDYLVKRKKQMDNSKIDLFKKTFDDIPKVYSCLNHISFYTGAERVVVIKVEDGGDVPSVTSHLHSTVLYEVFKNPLPSIKTHWQRVEVGHAYIKYVKTIYEEGFNGYVVNELEPSQFRDLHFEKGTGKVYSYFLMKSQKYFLYLSVQFNDQDVQLSAKGRNSIRINKDKLTKILKKESSFI